MGPYTETADNHQADEMVNVDTCDPFTCNSQEKFVQPLAKERNIRSGGIPELAKTDKKLAVNGRLASILRTLEEIVIIGYT